MREAQFQEILNRAVTDEESLRQAVARRPGFNPHYWAVVIELTCSGGLTLENALRWVDEFCLTERQIRGLIILLKSADKVLDHSRALTATIIKEP